MYALYSSCISLVRIWEKSWSNHLSFRQIDSWAPWDINSLALKVLTPYRLIITFACGKRANHLWSSRQLSSDTGISKQIVFQGCLSSNLKVFKSAKAVGKKSQLSLQMVFCILFVRIHQKTVKSSKPSFCTHDKGHKNLTNDLEGTVFALNSRAIPKKGGPFL